MATRESVVQSGYFVIADISGYTRFVASTELDHGQEILDELITVIIERLGEPFRFVELEGDAVFVYAPEASVTDSERLIDLIEACYAAFRMRIEQISMNSRCTCAACRAAPSLDLKAVAHFGTYARQKTPTGHQIIGADVTLLHMLLKNSVIQRTGIKRYLLATDAFVGRSSIDLAALPAYDDVIEPFGQVSARVLDLGAGLERHRERFRESLDAQAPDIDVSGIAPVPASLVWTYIVGPEQRARWQDDIKAITPWSTIGGRTDLGSEGHCDHGSYKLFHRIVDMRPPTRLTYASYSTGLSPKAPPPSQADWILEPCDDGTCKVSFQARLRNPNLLVRMLFKLVRPMVQREWQRHLDTLIDVVRQDREKRLLEGSDD